MAAENRTAGMGTSVAARRSPLKAARSERLASDRLGAGVALIGPGEGAVVVVAEREGRRTHLLDPHARGIERAVRGGTDGGVQAPAVGAAVGPGARWNVEPGALAVEAVGVPDREHH